MIPKLRKKILNKGKKNSTSFWFLFKFGRFFFCYQFIFNSLQLFVEIFKIKMSLLCVFYSFSNFLLLCLEFILICCRHLCRFQTSFWFGLFSVHPVNSWKRRIFHFITLEYPVMSRDNDEWTSGTRNHRCYHGEIGRIKSGKIKRQKKAMLLFSCPNLSSTCVSLGTELRVATNRNCSGLMTL